MSERHSFRARWVVPGDSDPLEDGVVEIESGRITALHNRHDAAAEDLGNVALIPGLINAHTHLEFSDLSQPLAPAVPFTDWIRALVTYRRGRSHSASVDAIESGIFESERSGTVCLGEIATPATPSEAEDEPGCDLGQYSSPHSARPVVFLELLGLAADQHDRQLELARQHLDRPPLPGIRCGLSPHAPYSVRPPLYAALVNLAQTHRCPLAVHLAETRAELQLLREGTGPFADLLRDFGVWDPTAIPSGTRSMDYLRPLADVEHALVIHGNYLAADEIDFLAEHQNISVVYCPRTHAYFGHAEHPWRQMLERGVSLAIGTDGRGSNPDLSVWRELQFLRQRFQQVDPARLLDLGTICGARALGLDEELGTLSPGKSADMTMISLPDSDGHWRDVLFDPRSEVIGTLCRGMRIGE